MGMPLLVSTQPLCGGSEVRVETKSGIGTRKPPKHPHPDLRTTTQWLGRDQKWHTDPKTTQTRSPGPQNHHTMVGARPKVAGGPENHPNTLTRTSEPPHNGWVETKSGIGTRKPPKHPHPDLRTTTQWLCQDQKWHRDPKTTQTPAPGPQNHHTMVGSRPKVA